MKHPVCQECGNEKVFKRNVAVDVVEKYRDGQVTEQKPESTNVQGWGLMTIPEIGEEYFGHFGVRCGKCGSDDVKLEE